jgi:hypothetical protein
LLEEAEKQSDDFSTGSYDNTGDIADQLDDEDPLQIHLKRSLEEQLPRGLPRGQRRKGGKQQKKNVHYHPDVGTYNEKRGRQIRKQDIPIPNPPPKPLSFGHRLLAAIMAPGDGPSRIHGLHGKKLMYVWHVAIMVIDKY